MKYVKPICLTSSQSDCTLTGDYMSDVDKSKAAVGVQRKRHKRIAVNKEKELNKKQEKKSGKR